MIGLGVGVSASWWFSSSHEPPAAQKPHEEKPASKVQFQPHQPSFEPNAAPERAPANIKIIQAKPLLDPFTVGQLLSTHETEKDESGNFKRIHLFKREDKYPLVRLDEYFHLPSGSHSQPRFMKRVAMVADHVLVKIREDRTREDLEQTVNELGGEIRREMRVEYHYLISFEADSPDAVEQMIESLLEQSWLIDRSEPDYLVSL